MALLVETPYRKMAIRLFLSFVMVLSVASQQNRMSDFGKRQPMTDNSQWMMETSQSQGQNKGFQRQGRQDIKPLSSSGAAPQDIPTMIRTELGNFMPMFVETAVKSILPKIESTVNRTVSGAISSLLQSTITSIVQSTLNSAGKPTPMEPFSTSQTGKI